MGLACGLSCLTLGAWGFFLSFGVIYKIPSHFEGKKYEGRLWTKCSTRRFVMAFHRFGTPILLVESLFSEFDSSNGQLDSAFHEVDSSFCEVVSSTCQFDSSAGLFDSSFYEFDSSRTTSVRRRLSFCRFVVSMCRFIVSMRRFVVSTRPRPRQWGYNSTYITWTVTWFHALLHEVLIFNLVSTA